MVKFFKTPFAESGDKTAVPDATQPDGSVSYDQGYGFDYQRDQDIDPLAKNVERDKQNQLFNDITAALRQYQVYAFPDFITTADNGGTAFSYSKYAVVRYDDGSGFRLYESLVDANTSLPTDFTKWKYFGAVSAKPGDGKDWWLSTVDPGWIWAMGTIGNASSNATNRANADTLDLFTAFWNDTAYQYTGPTADAASGQLQVFDASGVAVARGASAAADFAAGRQLSVPDVRGRVRIAKDNMNGTAANRMTGTVGGVNGSLLGANGGFQQNTLDVTQIPSHNHFNVAANIYQTNSPGSFGVAGVHGSGGIQGWNALSNPVGGDQPHNNVQPGIICNYLFKL